MTSLCVHAFRSDQCAACRICGHGLASSRCSRCLQAVSTPALRRAALSTHADHPAEEHAGFELVYAPTLTGWQILTNGEPTSAASYRSVFLARKAAEDLVAHPVVESAGSRN